MQFIFFNIDSGMYLWRVIWKLNLKRKKYRCFRIIIVWNHRLDGKCCHLRFGFLESNKDWHHVKFHYQKMWDHFRLQIKVLLNPVKVREDHRNRLREPSIKWRYVKSRVCTTNSGFVLRLITGLLSRRCETKKRMPRIRGEAITPHPTERPEKVMTRSLEA